MLSTQFTIQNVQHILQNIDCTIENIECSIQIIKQQHKTYKRVHLSNIEQKGKTHTKHAKYIEDNKNHLKKQHKI